MARTTRLNISVPTALQERLGRVKDSINVSRVCVAALERELGVREARPTLDAAQLELLVRRLQNNKERWTERGRLDAEQWAVNTATRDELRHAGERGRSAPPADADGGAPGAAGDGEPGLPRSFELGAALDRWVHADAGVRQEDVRVGPRGVTQYAPGVAGAVHRAQSQIDRGAYLGGWTAAVAEIWKAVRPALE